MPRWRRGSSEILQSDSGALHNRLRQFRTARNGNALVPPGGTRRTYDIGTCRLESFLLQPGEQATRHSFTCKGECADFSNNARVFLFLSPLFARAPFRASIARLSCPDQA